MSRSSGPRRRPPRGSASWAGTLRPWHATCLVMLGTTGCFYVKSIPPVEVNAPPTLVFPTDDPASVQANAGRLVLTVIATDAEGDTVFFEWPDLANTTYSLETYNDGARFVSRATVEPAAPLDGRTVRCFVSDGDPSNEVVARFAVEVP